VAFTRVSIERNGNSLGHLRLSTRLQPKSLTGLSPRTRDHLERYMVVALAGLEAERLATGRYNYIGASHDRKVVMELIWRITDGEKEAHYYFQWLRERARQTVGGHFRPVLHAIANALLQKRRLSFSEVAASIVIGISQARAASSWRR
jgi:hypothetical protein